MKLQGTKELRDLEVGSPSFCGRERGFADDSPSPSPPTISNKSNNSYNNSWIFGKACSYMEWMLRICCTGSIGFSLLAHPHHRHHHPKTTRKSGSKKPKTPVPNPTLTTSEAPGQNPSSCRAHALFCADLGAKSLSRDLQKQILTKGPRLHVESQSESFLFGPAPMQL